MFRTVIGGLLGGLALYLIGFVFWGTPLASLAFSRVDEATNAAVQVALAQGLTQSGSGVYAIPSPASSEGTILYGRGPVAQVIFNTGGFPVVDGTSLIAGLALALATGLLIAFALRAVPGNALSRSWTALLFSLGIVLWIHLGQPIFNHAPWGFFLYSAFAEFLGLAAAGLIAARWAGEKEIRVTVTDVTPPAVSGETL
jgi:hypothetical protein